jgi:5-methylcytosine-specific restriction enzyme A
MAWSKVSRHKRGYGAVWVKTREAILKRDNHLCQPCLTNGRPTPATQVDHIINKSDGGTDDHGNLQAICTDCHKDKTQREAAEARGRTYNKPVQTGVDGWPIDA